MLPRTKVSKDLGLAADLTNTSGRSASRAMPKAKLTYCLQLHCTAVQFQNEFGDFRQKSWTVKISVHAALSLHKTMLAPWVCLEPGSVERLKVVITIIFK